MTPRLAAPAIVLASLLLLPFLNKPFTMDDHLFLRAAAHALVDPLHPAGFEQVWNTGDRLPLSQYWLGGTLPAYVLAPVAALGSREWVAHLYQWLFLCALLMGSVSVARKLGCDRKQAGAVGMLVGSNPVALAMSATCMPDVMAAAFGVWGVDRALAFREERRIPAGLAAGALLAAAILCRGSAAAMLATAAMLLVPSKHKRAASCWWPVALAAALTAGWLFLQHGSAEAVHSLTGVRNAPRNLIGFLCFQALTAPLLAYWLLSTGWRFAVLAAGTVLLGVALSFAHSANLAAYAVPAALGVCWIAASTMMARDLGHVAPLMIWLCAGLAALPYVQMAAKYLLPGVPAAALLIVLHAGRVRQARFPLTVALLMAIGWISGAAIVAGDASLAGSQRAAVRAWVAPSLQLGKTVWAGGQWAFLGYAELAGARALANTPPLPQPGDTIVVSRLSYYGRFPHLPLRAEPVASFADRRCGVFVLNRTLAAGFFSSRFGYLPFALGCAELDRYDVYRVKMREVDLLRN